MHIPRRVKNQSSKKKVDVYAMVPIRGTVKAVLKKVGTQIPPIDDRPIMKISYDNKESGGYRSNLYDCLMTEADFTSAIGCNIPILKGFITKDGSIVGMVWYSFNWLGKYMFDMKRKPIKDLIDKEIKGYFSIDCYKWVNPTNKKLGLQQQLWKRSDQFPGMKESQKQMFDETGLHLGQFGSVAKKMVVTQTKEGGTLYQWVPVIDGSETGRILGSVTGGFVVRKKKKNTDDVTKKVHLDFKMVTDVKVLDKKKI